MRKLLAIAWNDVLVEYKEPVTWIFFLALPLVFTTLIGSALGNTSGGGSSTPGIVVPVADLDDSQESAALLQTLEDGGVLAPQVYYTRAEAQTSFEEDELSAMLVIPAGFGADLEANRTAELNLTEQAGSTTGLTVEQAVQTAAGHLQYAVSIGYASAAQAAELQPFASPEEEQAYRLSAQQSASDLLADPPVISAMVQGQVVETEPTTMDGFSQGSAGQLVTWVLITLLAGSEVFVNERLGGTLRRLLATPTSKATILLGKVISRFGQGMVQMIVLVGFGGLVLGVNWGSSLPALAILLVSFGLTGTALGLMLGAFARTRAQASGFSILFSMLLGSLGGAWWPLEITPQAYQTVVSVLPSTWAMRGLTDVILRNAGVVDILPTAGILLAFAAVFFTIGAWKLKFE